MLANKYNVDTLINLGDTFDSIKPTSAELDVYATFIRRLNKKIITLAADSHESTTQEESIVNHFGILNEMVTVTKEFKDGNHLYCGHFSIKESLVNYGAKLSKENFKEYFYVFLGHIHSYQLIKPNIVHLGSCRYVNFEEAKDEQKIVALISDYGTEKENTHFLKLKSPIPMIQLELGKNNPKIAQNSPGEPHSNQPEKDTLEQKSSISQAQNPPESYKFGVVSELSTFLDKTNPKTKIKVKILDFESFREFLPFCNKYSTKFVTFKYATEFDVVSDLTLSSEKNETTSFKESLSKWLDQQNVDQKIKDILQKEIE
jgi:DNA repair exonuclease SbcCD nuclease subunit